MKIVTWNVNGIRSINGQNPRTKYGRKFKKNSLFKYIEDEKPDILCLQETKANIEQINEDLRFPPGYSGNYNSSKTKKGYSGVVTYYKNEPKSVNDEIGIEKFDDEGRFLHTEFDNFDLLNIYFPKGYAESDRLIYKMEFYDAIFDYSKKIRNNGKKLIISGDYNTAHKEIDLARPKENLNTSGFLKEEREKLDWMVDNGFIDCFRQFEKDTGYYTWWSQRGRARENNVGWRIDYHFITNDLLDNLKNCYQQPDVSGSDHCPVVIELEF